MKLKGSHIYLRALEPEDLDFLYMIENNPDIWHLSHTQTPFSKFVLKQYLEASLGGDIHALKELRLVICRNEDNQPLGFIDLFDFDPKNKRAGVAIVIENKDNRGQGFGSEALSLLIDYAFSILDLHQLYANILSDNPESRSLFEKYNFKPVGVKRDWHFENGKFKDEVLYQRIKE